LVVGALLWGAVFLADITDPREWWKNRWLLMLGAFWFALSIVTISSVIEQTDYSAYRDTMRPQAFFENLRNNPDFVKNLSTFLAINLVAWGVPALGCLRGLALALGAMLPNILGNYGGAEKTGFLFHYHSFYFPVLGAAVCLSFAYAYRRWPRWAPLLLIGWLSAAGLGYNFNTSEFDFRVADLGSRSLSYPFKDYAATRAVLGQRLALRDYMDQFPGARVSTNEPLMPALYRHHSIAYYPLGIDDSDFVVVPISSTPDVYGGTFTYLGEEEKQRIDQCLQPRLKKRYRLLTEIGGVAVLTRNAF